MTLLVLNLLTVPLLHCKNSSEIKSSLSIGREVVEFDPDE